MLRTISISLFLLCLPYASIAQSWQANSPNKQVAVLELFTAEGCGLCPPADAWVKALPRQDITDDNLIVLGFHVDYLNDKKGWVDRFAKTQFADRQRQLARLNLFKTVYTPEFVVSGEVVHSWRENLIPLVKHINSLKPQADISLTATLANSELTVDAHIAVMGQENREHTVLYLALTQDNIDSKITAGDNAGLTLNHKNLVRLWSAPIRLSTTGSTEISEVFTVESDWQVANMNLVAIVQNMDDAFVLQGLKMPLND